MRILIAGVGRSGTTFLYKSLGSILIGAGKTKCFYEPLLWTHTHTRSPIETANMEYNTSFINHWGISVHLSTPLRPINKEAVGALLKYFEIIYERRDGIENVLVKDIRLNSRLSSLLDNYKDLKVIVMTRNFLNTLNSSSPLFSFFGDEFHKSDRDRFKVEFKVNEEGSGTDNDTFLSYQYWAHMTAAGIEAFKTFPHRVMVLPYELLVQDRIKFLKKVNKFCELEVPNIYDELNLQNPAGPTTPFRCLSDKVLKEYRSTDDEYLGLLSGLLPKKMLTLLKGGHEDLTEKTYVNQGFKEVDRKKLSTYYRKRYFDYIVTKERPLSTAGLIEKLTSSHVLKCQVDYLNRINSVTENINSKNSNFPEARGHVRIILVLNEKPICEVKGLVESIASQTYRQFSALLILYGADDQYRRALKAALEGFEFISIHERPASCPAEAIQYSLSDPEIHYVCFSLTTDPWLSTKLERELGAMADENIVLTYSDSIYNDGNVRLYSCASNNGRGQTDLLRGILDASIPIPQSYLVRYNLLEKPIEVPLGLTEENAWILLCSIVYRSLKWKSAHSGGVGNIVESHKNQSLRINTARYVERLFLAMSTLIDQYALFEEHDAFTRRLREILYKDYFSDSINELSDIIFSIKKNRDLIKFLEFHAGTQAHDFLDF
jgi:hypothetical protein